MNDQTIRPARSAVRRTPLPAPRPEARSNTTRVIHLFLLLAALHQLIGSQFIERPMPGDAPAWPYVMHEYVGLGTLGVVLAFWIWTVLRRGETKLGRLFPWFSTSGIGAVLADIAAQGRRLAKGRLPDEGDGALASAIHGLGLLTISAMAVTGAGFFFMDGTALGRSALAVHRLVANLMWAYLIAHAGLAALHQLLGADMVARMFWGRSRRDAAPLKRPS